MPGRRFLRSPWLPYAATIVSALPLGAIVAAANPQPAGACSGIGFGCSLYGWDAAAFLLLFVGGPYAFVLAIVLGVLSRARSRTLPVTAAWIGLAVPWVAVLGEIAR